MPKLLFWRGKGLPQSWYWEHVCDPHFANGTSTTLRHCQMVLEYWKKRYLVHLRNDFTRLAGCAQRFGGFKRGEVIVPC
jgi:hypothetical protein